MKGHDKVIELLNEVLTSELTAINQYYVHAKMCQNWGYERLWKKTYEESIGEMKHADQVIGRVLFLEGLPNLQRLGKVNVGTTVVEQLQLDLEFEKAAVARLNDGIALCRDLGDNGSRDLLQHILEDEEEHIDWLEGQLHAIDEMGIENYLAQQLHEKE